MRKWDLWYSLRNPKKKFSVEPKHFHFLADSDESAISKSLGRLRTIAGRSKKYVRFDILVRWEEGQTQTAGTGDKVYRVKRGYNGRRLLRRKNHRDYFVEGVGAEAWKALEG